MSGLPGEPGKPGAQGPPVSKQLINALKDNFYSNKISRDQLELQDLLVSPETEVTQVFLELLECRVIVVQLAWL